MKINRFVALGAIALLVLGGLGFVSVRALAHGSTSQDRPAQVTQAPDTDNVEEQVGDQNESDTAADVEQSGESAGDPEQGNPETDGETDQSALQTQAKITVEAAQQAALAAHAGGTILTSDLDEENGALVYSVEFADGLEVKVDAMTGVVLRTENGED